MNLSFLNLNTLQTLLSAALVAIPMFLLQLGCTKLATGDLDCSASALSPTVAGWILGGLAIAKFFVLPAMQPGGLVRNLFAPKVPVTPASDDTPGTVSPSDVKK